MRSPIRTKQSAAGGNETSRQGKVYVHSENVYPYVPEECPACNSCKPTPRHLVGKVCRLCGDTIA